MHEVIQRVLASEAQGKKILAEATAEAERLVANAHAKAQELLAQTRAAARRDAEDIVRGAVKSAERQREQHLTRVAEQLRNQVQLEPDFLEQVVQAAVSCVCGAAPAATTSSTYSPIAPPAKLSASSAPLE